MAEVNDEPRGNADDEGSESDNEYSETETEVYPAPWTL